MGKSIKESIEDKRIHHQLLPMRVDYEDGLDPVEDIRIMLKIFFFVFIIKFSPGYY